MWYSGQSMKLTTHLCLMPKYSLNGALPFLFLYTFVVWYLDTVMTLLL